MLDNILRDVKHKHTAKTTTTVKFKRDIWDLLMESDFEGDMLEVGCDVGNTTYVLGHAAKQLNKKVFSFELDENRINKAKLLCNDLNCEFIKKDVYYEPWDISNIGFIFIDASHEEDDVLFDLKNSFKLAGKSGIVVIHDYGLVTLQGSSVKSVIDNSTIYEACKFLGEKADWNSLGSGRVIDWEAAQIKIK